jgi:dihydroorotase
MTLLPAQRMEKSIPGMKKMGRLQVGSDANITIFDPQTVGERATYKNPDLPSEGIEFVLVNGTLVLDRGRIVEGVAPRRWLRHRYP